ncbi:MAG: hypothetical protein ABI035_07420 [Gemmatimonadaceae bacterium]
MRTRLSSSAVAILLLGGVGLTSCSSDKKALPTGVDPAVSASVGAGKGVLRCQVASEIHVLRLFQPPLLGPALSQFGRIDVDLLRHQPAAAVNDMYTLWKYTLDGYYAGNLRGAQSAQTQDLTLKFGQALYCLVGLDGSQLTLTTTPLDQTSVVKVVFPSPTDQTVVTGTAQAGLMIPGGTLTQPVTISVTPITGNFTFPAGPLNTKLDQYGPFFEFKVVPEQAFATPVLAASCISTAAGDAPPGSVDIAHNVGTGIEILPTESVPFLVCGGTGMVPQPSAFELARSGEYGKAFKRLGSSIVGIFTPAQAFAVASGIGGRTTTFSPFGGVDTSVVAKLPVGFPAQPQIGGAGSNVASAPSVLIETPNGHTPLGGASVTMTVMSGGGSIGPMSTSPQVTTSTLTSDGTTGLATVPNWTLGAASANSVTANASFTLPTSISGFPTAGKGSGAAVVVSGNPLTFTATSTNVVPYQAAGYMYLSGDATVGAGFEQPTFDASSWATGTGAFGSANLGGSCLSLVSTVGTTWVNNPGGVTYMLLRKSFTLPAWWTGGVTIGIAIDNDFQAFVDGVNVTPTNVPTYNATTGFVSHEGCAALDSFTFPANANGGNHILAIRARDRGTAAYVDTRVGVNQ